MNLDNLLGGRTAIVTGASRGIGRACALRLSQAGAFVLLHGTDKDRLTALRQVIAQDGGRAQILVGDVTDPATARNAVVVAERDLGPVAVLVNNAGINRRSSTLDMPLEDWHRVLDVNLNGTLHFCRAVLPGMIDRKGGVIVNVSSTTAKTPHKNAAPAYGASKAAVNYLTMHLAQEMAPHGIRVNGVCPGPVETDMSRQWSAEYRERVTAAVPLGRLGQADDIAGTVLFLASDLSSFVTGETVNANGGTYMN
ncbi:SDR family NAD(P)-dependent oxidoreductase [Antarctobacter heliothermus]|uniref:3-oxoacyl-[acyl-carrier protein] reductase n=1 Tax=Antarctobacter heliothermus TaxID=74033 RepID=A0A239KPL6_9RHOB|nr:SDR family NAD(P)-dependent oxidoreductase [Antarctobacter heliothermus]SNT20306.1 3-oxoacyl-[acyl-carrier protein] reductase [Antarctobacter heliothermus]